MTLKILDYGVPAPFGRNIGKQRNLAWPVNVYRVTLPRISHDDDGLNAFERVILKFINAVGAMNPHALADQTCIPLDLVKGIVLRLQDKGFIDKHNAIIERDDDHYQNEEDKAPVFVTALLFRELVSGKLLPFLDLLNATNQLQIKENEQEYFPRIHSNDAYKNKVPRPHDVISVLRAMKRRSSAFGGDNKIPNIQQITIIQQPEPYHLDCPIAIQASDSEFRIADPFGNGFSLILESSFEQLLEHDEQHAKWLAAWKKNLRNPQLPKLNAKPRELFESDINQSKYPKLVTSLRPSQDDPFRSIAKIHASIEWALFHACCRHSFDDAIMRLRLTVQLEQPALLGNAAKHVGLVPPTSGFMPIREGKILDFLEGKAELGTVLVIAILQADSDASHPLCHIAAKHPDLIGRLLDIKKKRDEKGHGKGGADAPKIELPDDQFMREIVHLLLPEIIFSDSPRAGEDKDARADSLLDARANIQSEFGFKVFNRLGTNLQDRLIQAERFWLSCHDHDDALVFVCDLYAALQASFHQRLFGQLPPDIMDVEFITTARLKARETGIGDLPKCLSTVKPLAIRQTLQGNAPTLGACVVAFLLMSDHETLSAVADLQPSFLDDIANVITRRGHGNEPLPLPKADIEKIRKASYKTIKTLIEA